MLKKTARMMRRTSQLPLAYVNWPTAIRQRLRNRETANGLVTYKMRRGPSLTVAGGPEDLAIINDVWIDRCYEPDRAFVPQPGWVVADIGSNKGSYATRALHLTGGQLKKLICVEPEPTNFECLRQNVSQFNGTVELVNAAVGAAAGDATLYRVHGSSGQHSLSEKRASREGQMDPPINVEVVPLDKIVELASGHIDLLKLDCEGGEYPIVVDSDPDVLAKIARITMEYDILDHASGRTPKDLRAALERAGFTVRFRGAGQASGRLMDAWR